MILIIVISALIGFFLWLLLGPVIIFVNSDTRHYHLALPGIFKAIVVPTEELFHIRGWIFFIPYKFDPFQQKKKKRVRKTKKPNRKRGSIKLSKGIQLINKAGRSIRIRKLFLDLDTDDFILNAWLIPVFSSVNSGSVQMKVNFNGTSSLLLDLRTRLGTLLWILIRNKYKSFINL